MAGACWRSFIGDPSNWTHLTTNSFLYYNLTAPTWMSWWNVACTTLYDALCEVPVTQYACPLRPPSPPRLDVGTVCLPPDTDIKYCPSNLASCYFMSAATGSLATAKTNCGALGGALVSWESYAEQSQVGQPSTRSGAFCMPSQCR